VVMSTIRSSIALVLQVAGVNVGLCILKGDAI
jgi:hypothetical protein